MNIVYCCPGQNSDCEKAKRVIEMLISADAIESFYLLSDFETFLRHGLTSGHLVILHAGSLADLESFLALRELLAGNKVILILPDRSRDTVDSGHSLRPRFITYNDSDFLEMAAVVRHILESQTGNFKEPSSTKSEFRRE